MSYQQLPLHYQEAINRALDYLETQAHTAIQLEDIAQEALLSKYHFHRIFKTALGHTTRAYLTRIRLDKAATLLRYTAHPITTIAYRCGYPSPEHFTRAFKQHFGIPPSLFKQQSEVSPPKKPKGLAAPQWVQLDDLHLAYIRHFGSYDKVGASFRQLMAWATKRWVWAWRQKPLGIVHDQPDLTAEPYIRFDACLPVKRPIEPEGAIGYKLVRGGRFVVFRYRGSYNDFLNVYEYIYNVCLMEYQLTLRDDPALEQYVKGPPLHKPHQYVTDFYVPIE